MKKLGERINKAGMQFGIWFEPEGISEDSDLYRAHPDWAVHIAGRRPDLSRHQLILDISRWDVQDYIIERLGSVLEEAPITYIKWDMNRSICDKYTRSLGADRQGEFSHRFVLGLYRILETLNERFPYILIEGCSGGADGLTPGCCIIHRRFGAAIIQMPSGSWIFNTGLHSAILFPLWAPMCQQCRIIRPGG